MFNSAIKYARKRFFQSPYVCTDNNACKRRAKDTTRCDWVGKIVLAHFVVVSLPPLISLCGCDRIKYFLQTLWSIVRNISLIWTFVSVFFIFLKYQPVSVFCCCWWWFFYFLLYFLIIIFFYYQVLLILYNVIWHSLSDRCSSFFINYFNNYFLWYGTMWI
jgi:hypothetical protein